MKRLIIVLALTYSIPGFCQGQGYKQKLRDMAKDEVIDFHINPNGELIHYEISSEKFTRGTLGELTQCRIGRFIVKYSMKTADGTILNCTDHPGEVIPTHWSWFLNAYCVETYGLGHHECHTPDNF